MIQLPSRQRTRIQRLGLCALGETGRGAHRLIRQNFVAQLQRVLPLSGLDIARSGVHFEDLDRVDRALFENANGG